MQIIDGACTVEGQEGKGKGGVGGSDGWSGDGYGGGDGGERRKGGVQPRCRAQGAHMPARGSGGAPHSAGASTQEKEGEGKQ